MNIRQAVILCGGLGSRLGALTAETPKPLLAIAGKPFLQILIQELTRFGVEEVLLLAAFGSDRVEAFARALPEHLWQAPRVVISIEPERCGTGGALYHARDKLAAEFLLLNGDSLFDVDLTALSSLLGAEPAAKAAVALRPLAEAGRYGTAALAGSQITRFGGAAAADGPVLINGGVYAMRSSVLEDLRPSCSLENDVLPVLAQKGQLRGMRADGFFLDIGVPEDFARAQTAIPAHRLRPAVFLDRDGVINRDDGHVGTQERFIWNEGVAAAIRMLNERGFYVFVVTNQAGIGKGYYTADDYRRLRRYIRDTLAEQGARIDDERHCADHPDAVIEAHRRVSDWRKPAPGMILDLMRAWPVATEMSFLIGDKASDIAAAEAAGLAGHLFEGGRLDMFVARLLADRDNGLQA